jgi:hypothetical protein
MLHIKQIHTTDNFTDINAVIVGYSIERSTGVFLNATILEECNGIKQSLHVA